MKRKEYSAGAVKHSFWFMEFRNEAKLLSEGKSFEEIRELCRNENIFAASTPERSMQIFNTVSSRIKAVGSSFYPIFLDGDVATQKIFNLAAIMANDTLFFDFMYEVVREKMIIGTSVLTDADIRIFFKNKQTQDEVVAKWTEQTLQRLGRSYKAQLYEAGILDDKARRTERQILKPILDPTLKYWLEDYGYGQVVKALEGVR